MNAMNMHKSIKPLLIKPGEWEASDKAVFKYRNIKIEKQQTFFKHKEKSRNCFRLTTSLDPWMIASIQ